MDFINDDLTLDVECPHCEKLLPRRGLKISTIYELPGNYSLTCPYCSEDFQIQIGD